MKSRTFMETLNKIEIIIKIDIQKNRYFIVTFKYSIPNPSLTFSTFTITLWYHGNEAINGGNVVTLYSVDSGITFRKEDTRLRVYVMTPTFVKYWEVIHPTPSDQWIHLGVSGDPGNMNFIIHLYLYACIY